MLFQIRNKCQRFLGVANAIGAFQARLDMPLNAGSFPVVKGT